MIGKFDNIKIQGISAAVPKQIEENMSYENVLGKRRVKKQIAITGVEKRHVSGWHQRTSDLCYAAAIKLLDKLKWKKDDIKVLIYITQGPNYCHPSTAFFLHMRLGLGKDCLAYDMNLGCSSFNVGVHTVSALLQSCNLNDKALLLAGDIAGVAKKPETSLNPDNVAHDMLFGSAGAAIALEKVKENSLYFLNKSDGNGFDVIIQHRNLPSQMDGAAVFSFAINDVSDSVIEFRNHFGLTEDKIDYYVFHQAQQLILDNILDSCNIPEEKEIRSLKEYGNTSGTSVPVTICANQDLLQQKKTQKLLLCGFGVGLSWGCIYTEVDTENILPIIETDEHYDEDKVPTGELRNKNILVLGADTVMGEWLTRFDNDKSAMVILAGKDQEKMLQIRKDLFLDSDSVVMESFIKEEIHKVFEYCKEVSIDLNGVVIPVRLSKELLAYISQELFNSYGTQDTSVVVLESVEKEEELESYKRDMESKLKGTGCKSEEKHVRVNGVVYVETQLDIVQVEKNGQEWIQTYFARNCPETMKKPIYVAQTQKYLLLEHSKYMTESVLALNA